MSASHTFARSMARPAGRGIRIAAGLALIAAGSTRTGSHRGAALMIVGLVPLLAGLFNVCMLAPLIGAPFSGRAAYSGREGG